MVSVNKTSKESNLTTNLVAGDAYEIKDKKLKLYSITCNRLFGEPKYYEYKTEDEMFKLIDGVVTEGDPRFPLQLAQYARQEMYLRTTPVVILGYCSLIKACQPYIKAYLPQIIQRADEMAEVIAYIRAVKGHIGNQRASGSLPSALKKGLANKFWEFKRYNIQKYLQEESEVKMRDVIKLVHPKPPTDDDSKFLKGIIEGTVHTPTNTWESSISTKGSTTENWEKAAFDMPIMALLRNLRNLLDAGVNDKTIDAVVAKLTNPDIILKSKQFPFRFWSAYNVLSEHTSPNTGRIMEALETAMDISVDNFAKLPGTTAIGVDHSGSMNYPISEHSKITRRDVGDALVGCAHRICEKAIPFVFSDQCIIKNNLTKRAGVLTNKQLIHDVETGGGNYYPIYTKFVEDKINVDRFIIFTDEEIYTTLNHYGQKIAPKTVIAQYRREVNPNTLSYMVNLAGFGTTVIDTVSDKRNILVAGWSDKIFDYINRYEQDQTKITKYIEQIGLNRG